MKRVAAAVFSVLLLSCAQGAAAQAAEPSLMSTAERDAAMTRAPHLQPEVEAALSQPMHDLYVEAQAGGADDVWTYGLALFAARANRVDVPADQLKTFDAYMKRAETARRAYQKTHPKTDTFAMPPSAFVTPSEQEAQAYAAFDAVNSADIWLDAASDANDDKGNPAIDPAVLAQSQGCIYAVRNRLDAINWMSGFIGDIGLAGQNGKIDPNAIKDVEDDSLLDAQALCGGETAYAHYIDLMSAYYQP